ncbi:MAG: rRNA maturation RNase YbeY [Proteobacteria bacterium]|nr:rRNA maturation RNase YbeY [Pseudomonadota bacterium]
MPSDPDPASDPEPEFIDGTGTDEEMVVVSINDEAWVRSCRNIEILCQNAALAALAASTREPVNNPEPSGEVTIVLTDDSTVHTLNRTYRGKDQPTNVLSFAAGPAPATGINYPLGDVVLGFSTVHRECLEAGRPIENHLQHLVVHGCLHLLGFDHESDAEAAEMEMLETEILAGLGVPNPYAVDPQEAAP